MAGAPFGDPEHRRPLDATVGAAGPALRALVVDDEAPALEELAYLLRQDRRVAKVSTAGDGAAALRALDGEDFDVVFSDISMPGLDGMDLARVIARFARRPRVVFVTAHDEHAVDAFAIDAVDYVMKPVRPDRLAEAVRRVVASGEAGMATVGSGAAAGTHGQDPPGPQPDDDETIPVELGGVIRFIARSEIRYAQAQGDYARLHTATGSHLVRIPLTVLEERWATAGFVRIHRSTLVSLAHVTEIRMEHGHCSVVLDGVELQVSRRHTRHLRDRLLRPVARSAR
ncbi:LytR/AlgR family response regulator transcription factor [Pedococcus sp. 5OH_020]|uniref:LytR/AlgR family response regulator transcription factor n=1 Tax=Pedococcus sp. 5OH_020 TaxID=2989814 RepID=UPI0022E9CA04|nr:LytTR family DNA-binding domain-containing protein [Pedococcus sp. 5OH_020]